jgi:hypothetical protein
MKALVTGTALEKALRWFHQPPATTDRSSLHERA